MLWSVPPNLTYYDPEIQYLTSSFVWADSYTCEIIIIWKNCTFTNLNISTTVVLSC